MVHKLRDRDVCQTSPRPSQVQSALFSPEQRTVAHSTPNHKRQMQPESNSVLETIPSSLLEAHFPTITLNQWQEEISLDNSADLYDLNVSKYKLKLHKLVDKYIFSNTFKKRSGVSLYAIRKALKEEHSCHPFRIGKPVSLYIALGIATGKFRQITGHGASGTFRLNRTIHAKYAHQLRKLHKVSSHSHTIQRRAQKQAKANTMP
ncbi:histone H1.2-like [Anastrepha obliqua]|uniref:histone H1.2-like n=1 Tax=Anastrepha obliqua TaxID=95512 RepID=UPI00240A671F|nr:histone H1.2-like [Anastrepha obliqua]